MRARQTARRRPAWRTAPHLMRWAPKFPATPTAGSPAGSGGSGLAAAKPSVARQARTVRQSCGRPPRRAPAGPVGSWRGPPRAWHRSPLWLRPSRAGIKKREQHIVSRLSSRRVRGGAAGCLFIELERLVAPFDRNDRICHRNVDHRVLSKLRERRTTRRAGPRADSTRWPCSAPRRAPQKCLRRGATQQPPRAGYGSSLEWLPRPGFGCWGKRTGTAPNITHSSRRAIAFSRGRVRRFYVMRFYLTRVAATRDTLNCTRSLRRRFGETTARDALVAALEAPRLVLHGSFDGSATMEP